MLFQPYIVIHENVQDDSEVVWAPLSNETKCFLSSQNFFHVVALKFTHDLRPRHILGVYSRTYKAIERL